jgi:hypothetical protein
MPDAPAVLAFLSAFLTLWGLSLLARGIFGDRRRSDRRCPSCGVSMSSSAGLYCPSCAFEARSERQLHRPKPHWFMLGAGALSFLLGLASAYAAVMVHRWVYTDPNLKPPLTQWNAAAVAVALFWLCTLVWAIRGERAKGRRRCPRCWYDMQGGGGGLRCPECGHQAKHTSDLYRPRRRKRWAAAAIVGMLSAIPLYLWPKYQQGGILGITPTTVLIAGIPWLPESAILQGPFTANSLHERLIYDRLAAWQERWLQRRCRSLLRSTDDYQVMHRCLILLQPRSDQAVYNVVRTRLISQLVSDDAMRSQQAATLIMWHNLFISWNEVDHTAHPIPGLADSADVLAQLRQLTHFADPMVAHAACALLASSPPDAAAAMKRSVEIAAATRGPHSWWANTIARIAAASDQGMAALLGLLDNPDPMLRITALRGLPVEAFDDPVFVSKVQQLLLDPDITVAQAAAQRVRYQFPWVPLASLVRAFHASADDPLRRAMLYEYLATFHDRTIAWLGQQFADMLSSGDPELRTAVLDLLQSRQASAEYQDSLVPFIEPLTEHHDPAIANDAARALEIITAITATPAP